MRKLLVNSISNSVGFPFKSGTFIHLQLAYTEAIAQAIISRITGYDPTKIYTLDGCFDSDPDPDHYVFTEGSVFYNGEVFTVPPNQFTKEGFNVPVFKIITSFFSAPNADSVVFTDGVPRNVHEIRQMLIQPGLSGSGISNVSDAIFLAKPLPANLNPEIYLGTFDQFDAAGIGIAEQTRGYALCDGQGGRPDMRGMMAIGAKQGDANFPAAGNTGGSKTASLVSANNGPHTHTVDIGYINGESDNANDRSVAVPGSNTKTTSSSGSGTPFSILNPYYTVLWVVRLN